MMVRRFCFVMCLVLSLAVICNAATTDPNIITAVSKVSSVAGEDLVVLNGGFVVGEESHVDRTYLIDDVGSLGGIDFIRTAVDDKNNSSAQYSVTVDTAGYLLLLIDNRVGDDDGTDAPTLGGGLMDWVSTDGYVATNYQASTSNTPMTAFVRDVDAGTYDVYQQFDGTGRIMYLVAAVPDGYNLPPLVSGVPATASIAPGETLDIDATIEDMFGDNTSTSVVWSNTDGGTVVFSPSATSEDVSVSFPDGEGNYTLEMTVTDGNGGQTVKTVEVAVEIPKFAIERVNYCQACNDSDKGPDAHVKSSRHYARNHSAPRRRIEFIQYDISAVKEAGKVFANSFLTMNRDKGSTNEVLSVFAVKDGLDDIDLDSGTWNTLPGLVNTPAPDPALPITLDTMDLSELSPLLIEDTDITNDIWYDTPTSAALDEFMNADTNGIILLVFVTFSPEDADFEIRATSTDDATGVEGIALRGNVIEATLATSPVPAINTTVTESLSQLSWSNPADTVSTDVYFAIGDIADPNEDLAGDHRFTLLADADKTDSVVELSTGTLVGGNTYTWVVNVTGVSGTPRRGFDWRFSVVANAAPSVDIANPTQYVWLGNAGDGTNAEVVLDATVTDDGQIQPVTLLWEQTAGPAVITIDPSDVEDITLNLYEPGSYGFKLTANDGENETFASAEIIVAEDACMAAQAVPGYTASIADFDGNCVVDLNDFAAFAAEWLDCNSLDCN